MNVWIFQSGEPLISDGNMDRPMRAMNLANALVNKGHKVILWSSAFYHQKKMHRSRRFKKIFINSHLEIRLIPSPGYKKNVSISRLIDHFKLAFNLYKKINLEKIFPDVAFVGYPPIETAYIMTHWLKKKKIPSILDIKDQWPVILAKNAPKIIKPFLKIILTPYYWLAKKAMRNASCICAMSGGFIDWSLNFCKRKKSKFDIIAPLTSPVNDITETQKIEALSYWSNKGIKNNKKFRIIFIGSFSNSFDFDEIFKSAEELYKLKKNCEFILCGDGDLAMNLRNKEKKFKNIKIIEWIDIPKIITLSNMSSAFIAPYKNSSDFMISVPNKIIDAFRLELPLLSPLKGEVEALIKNYKAGYCYTNHKSLTKNIISLLEEKKLQKKMSKNSKKIYNDKFEFNKVYDNLITSMQNLYQNK